MGKKSPGMKFELKWVKNLEKKTKYSLYYRGRRWMRWIQRIYSPWCNDETLTQRLWGPTVGTHRSKPKIPFLAGYRSSILSLIVTAASYQECGGARGSFKISQDTDGQTDWRMKRPKNMATRGLPLVINSKIHEVHLFWSLLTQLGAEVALFHIF